MLFAFHAVAFLVIAFLVLSGRPTLFGSVAFDTIDCGLPTSCAVVGLVGYGIADSFKLMGYRQGDFLLDFVGVV